MNRNAIPAFFAVVVTLLLGASSLGQVATGTPPFGSFSNGGFDTVNLANLNVHLGIPILSKPGRGLPFHYVMDYESSIWAPTIVGSSTIWQPVNTKWGWTAQSEALTGTVPIVATSLSCFVTDPSGQRHKYFFPATEYTGYKDPGGTFHAAPIITTDGYDGCDNGPFLPIHTGLNNAYDGSGYRITVNELGSPVVQVQNRGGWTIPNPGTATGTVIDTNGNELTTTVNGTTTTFTDTLGTTALTVNASSSSLTTYSYTAPSGAAAQFKFNYTQTTVQTNFGCSGIGEYPATQVYLLTSVVLPDSTQYSFGYEQTPGKAQGIVTGRIASVILPTGGTISYAYSLGNNGIICTDGSTATLQRTTPDGTWTYAHAESSNWTTTTTDPQGNQSVYTFAGIYETARTINQKINGVQTTLYSTATCYNNNCANQWTLPITRRTVWVYLPTSTGLQSKTDTFLNSLGLTTEVDQYAYGSAPGALLRKTLITYNTTLTNNILDHPSSVVIQDGSAHVIGQTTYTYDEGQVSQNTGTPPQHVSVSGSRGNLTTLSRFYSATGSLNGKYSYYDTGTVNVATDVNGAQTTFGYGNGPCGYSFPDSVTLPLSLSRSTAYNCTGGVSVSVKDENGNTSYVNYTQDSFFWRPESTQDTTGALIGITYSGATQAESALNFNGGNSTVDLLTTLDPLGRVLYTQQKESPTSSNYDSNQRIYDALDALVKATMPYVGTAGQANPPGTAVATTNYDTLGRTALTTDGGGGTVSLGYTKNDVLQTVGPAPTGENTKRKQLEYDALGRLTSVCEVTTATSSGACGQTVAQTGFLTTYVYDTTTVGSVLYSRTTVTQNAQPGGTPQHRVYVYDLLGRLISETNPESGATAYVYDTDSTCGTFAGDRVKRTDAVGNVSCYALDQLHRVLSITYPSGSYAASTPKKYYVYDGATVNGSPMGNAKGRLAEAYTCATCPGTKITDLGFNYTARGEVGDVYESTPHSSGYYHVNATYWENGALKVLNAAPNALPGLPQQTYGVDGQGRPNSVTAASGQNPVTSAVYDLTNYKTTVNYGSLDSDVFTFDPNTGREKQYQFNVAGQSVIGQVNWNANGTLGSLVITDPLNASNSQTCNYSHDDLSRIASANCGSAWSQTFGPDPLGNLTKSGTGSFLPTYDPATNRFLSIPGGTPTYDNNGNLTYDLSHSYTWDAEGKTLSIDTVNLIYDALGRMVEQARGAAYTQIVYGPAGRKLALMNGQTLQKAFVALPGGTTAVYTASGLAYYRHADWLGSSRLATTPTRTKYYDVAYGPYGESYAGSGTTDLSFTGENQDTVSGLYDFMYREYHPGQGRWISPDPAGLAVVDPTSPQSWNRYAYVLNNPLTLVDPLGLEWVQACVQAGGGDAVCQWFWDDTGAGGGNPFPTGPVTIGVSGAGGGGNGGGNGASGSKGKPTCFPTSSLNWSQKAQLAAAQFYAALTGWTFGFGAGLDAGAGIGPKGSSWNLGVGGSASTLIVADGSGNSGFLNSASGGFSAVKMGGAGSRWGAGAAAGPSVLVSPNPISTIAGPSGSFSAGGGAVLGAGISVTTSGAATATFGVGAGAEAGVSPQFGTSQFIPFCHN